MTSEEAIAAYLAKGGAVTRCPTSAAYTGRAAIAASKLPRERRPKRKPWWIQRRWTLVRIKADRIGAAESWLRDRGHKFYTNLTRYRGFWHVRVEDAKVAVMFKLTWGGDQ